MCECVGVYVCVRYIVKLITTRILCVRKTVRKYTELYTSIMFLLYTKLIKDEWRVSSKNKSNKKKKYCQRSKRMFIKFNSKYVCNTFFNNSSL